VQKELSARLGTGHGRHEYAPVRHVRFERESPSPAQIVMVHYDRAENLVALGVIPPPVVASRRVPDPFPAMSFVPDPPRR
jgi:hypothetical protein